MSLAAAGVTVRFKPRSLAEFCLLWLTIFVMSVMSVALVTGFAGIYSREVATSISCLLGVLGGLSIWKHRPEEGSQTIDTAHWGWGFSAILSLLAAPFIVRLFSPSLPQRAFDDFSYQGPAAFEFVVKGGMGIDGRLRYHAFFPLNAELFASWLHLPTHSDAYWWLAGMIWAVLAASAVYVAARRLGATPTAAGLAALSVSASRGVVLEWATHTATDLAAAALFLSTIVLADDVRRGVGREGVRMQLARMLLCGACAGGVLGMKISFAPVLALLAIWLLIVTRRSDLCLRGVALFSAACLCLGGFWYLRNWLVLGNPLSPAEVGPFWGPFDSESQWRTTLAPWLWGEYASLQNWKTVILGYGNQNGLLILFPAIGIALQAFASLRRQSRSSQETRRLILAAALLLIAFFPFTPFYGTVNNPDASIGVRPRFVIGIFALGAVLLAPHLRGPRRSLVAFACILSALNLPWLVVGAVLWGVASGVRGLWIAVHRKRDQGTRRLSIPGYKLVSAAVVFCWLLLAVAEPWIAHRTNRSLYSYVYHGVHFGDAWRRVNKLPPGSRIAASGFRANFILGIYGRKLQHEPVVLYENGSAVDQRFYELWNRFRRGKRWWERWYPDPVPTLEHQTSDRCMKRNQK